jgi:hypothetical protein
MGWRLKGNGGGDGVLVLTASGATMGIDELQSGGLPS